MAHSDNMEITLEAAVWQYIQYLQVQKKSVITVNAYTWDLKQVVDFFGIDCPLSRITIAWVGRFLKSPHLLEKRNGQPRSARTVAKTIRVFRMFMQWLVQVNYLPEITLPKAIQLKAKINTSPNTDC